LKDIAGNRKNGQPIVNKLQIKKKYK